MTAAFLDVETELGGRTSTDDRRRSRWSARDLCDADFPAPSFAVPGIVADGVTLLVGAPKIGKSWLVLSTCWAVACGGVALGRVPVEQRPALLLALEDRPPRLQRRIRTLFGREQPPTGFDVWFDWHPGDVTSWAADHPGALVVVDVLARVRDQRGSDNLYASDYAALVPLKKLADDHGCHVVVTHHDRKAGADDWTHTVSGTQGLAGAADTLVVLRRNRGKADGTLLVTGRDVEDAELPLSFDRGAWTLLDGHASDYELGDTRRRILEHLRQHGAARPKEIALALTEDYELVKKTVRRMLDADQLDTDGQGLYFTPSTPVPPVPAVPERDRGDRRDTPTGDDA